MHEVELKFQVPRERRLALAAALQMSTAPRSRLLARYFDTADGRLAASRLSLRIRKEGRVWVQTLKAPGDSAVHRLEHNVPRPGRWGDAGPPLDIGLHGDSPAGVALRAVLDPTLADPAAALQVVYHADIRRRVQVVDHQGALIELALDEGELRAGDRTAPVLELELELKQGSPAALVALAKQAVHDQGLWLSTVPKAARGERLARGQVHGEPTRAEAPRLRGRMDAATVVRTSVACCLEQVLANASEIADGSRQAEHVHQLRVGLRRLRTALRELGDLAVAVDPAWEAPLAAAFGELGEFRDADTVTSTLAASLAAAGAPPATLPAAAGTIVDPVQTVRSPAFQDVLLDLLAFTMAPGSPSEDSAARPTTSVRKQVRTRLARLHQQVLRDGERFEALDETAQHRVRKRLKRLRYLAELVGDLFERDAVERYLKHLRPAQDALGEHNDMLVGRGLYRDAAERGQPAAWFAVGWLTAQLPRTARRCRKALCKIASAERFW